MKTEHFIMIQDKIRKISEENVLWEEVVLNIGNFVIENKVIDSIEKPENGDHHVILLFVLRTQEKPNLKNTTNKNKTYLHRENLFKTKQQ